ncbi:MAG: hypothetical protein ACQETH_05420 [Candidatus Rifleibacteriota bacterium]
MATKDKSKKERSNDPLELRGLSPDELADKILGISEVKIDDEAADPEAAKFWFEAAYGDELKGMFKEKNRMRILVSSLAKRGYNEDEIREIFVRVQKAKFFSEKAQAEAQARSEELRNKITRFGIVLMGIFIIYHLVIKTNELAEKQEQNRIKKIKTFSCSTERPPVFTREKIDTDWDENIRREFNVTEGMTIKTERFPCNLIIAENAVIELMPTTELKIVEAALDDTLNKVDTVSLEPRNGTIKWNLKEESEIKFNLKLKKGSLAIGYGEGKYQANSEPPRIAVKEGETRFRSSSLSLPMAINGLMELYLKEPLEKKLYDSY